MRTDYFKLLVLSVLVLEYHILLLDARKQINTLITVIQVEDEKIAKEKAELREALAKARGDLARERAKLSAVQAKPTSLANNRSPSKRIEMCQQNERYLI